MIKLTRVDYRLIHGQVAMSWTHALDVDCILLASDAVAKDDMRKAALRLAAPTALNSSSRMLTLLSRRSTAALPTSIRCLSSLRRLKMSIVSLRVAKTSKRSIWVEPERPPRPRFIRPRNLRDRERCRAYPRTPGRCVAIEIRQVPNDAKVFAKDVF